MVREPQVSSGHPPKRRCNPQIGQWLKAVGSTPTQKTSDDFIPRVRNHVTNRITKINTKLSHFHVASKFLANSSLKISETDFTIFKIINQIVRNPIKYKANKIQITHKIDKNLQS